MASSFKETEITSTGFIQFPKGDSNDRPLVRTVVESFTDTGTTSWIAPTGVSKIDVLVVAGGGSGSAGTGGGGGGGGLIHKTDYSVTPGQSYTVTVGAGATGAAADSNTGGSQGGNSVFDALTAIGGGAGAIGTEGGGNGGSGGGAGNSFDTNDGISGVAVPGQGNNGGYGREGSGGGNSGNAYSSGGGGGAGGPGGTGSRRMSGAGGPGLPIDITGSVVYYAAGGGGGADSFRGTYGGPGGLGGGGDGGGYLDALQGAGQDGVANTGSGGGGGSNQDTSGNGGTEAGGDGGSGIVIIRYQYLEEGLGDELILNGTFETDTTNWTASSATITSSNGLLVVTDDNADSTGGRAYQTITTEIGKRYRVYAEVSGTANPGVYASINTAYGTNLGGYDSTGVIQFDFTATATTSYILLVSGSLSGGSANFDNVSCKEIISQDPFAVSRYNTDVDDIEIYEENGWSCIDKTKNFAGHNLLPYSYDITQWTTTGAITFTSTSEQAPDGTSTAVTLTDDNDSGYEVPYQNVSIESNKERYVASIFVRKAKTQPNHYPALYIQFRGGNSDETSNIRFNHFDGTASDIYSTDTDISDFGVIDYDSEWWRIFVSAHSSDGSHDTVRFHYNSARGTDYTNFAGTNVATGSTTVWGAQLEKGHRPGTITITNGAATEPAVELGDYRYHAYKNTGESGFTPGFSGAVEVLVVGGGGGGAAYGGGGSGGVIHETEYYVEAYKNYTVRVGQGGAAEEQPRGTNGDNSVFGNIVGAGGGGGASDAGGTATYGFAGGSGGGGAGRGLPVSFAGGPGAVGQGNAGGFGYTGTYGGGGGGGAGTAGMDGESGDYAGDGGNGIYIKEFASFSPDKFFGGGGGAGSYQSAGGTSSPAGAGGFGGGGDGSTYGGGDASPGTANTGGGGGGSSDLSTDARGGAGGSGIVIVRYKIK